MSLTVGHSTYQSTKWFTTCGKMCLTNDPTSGFRIKRLIVSQKGQCKPFGKASPRQTKVRERWLRTSSKCPGKFLHMPFQGCVPAPLDCKDFPIEAAMRRIKRRGYILNAHSSEQGYCSIDKATEVDVYGAIAAKVWLLCLPWTDRIIAIKYQPSKPLVSSKTTL